MPFGARAAVPEGYSFEIHWAGPSAQHDALASPRWDRSSGRAGQTCWVDPAVHLWNRSLLANLRYGNDEHGDDPARVVETAELRRLIETLPLGLQTPLGEGGGLVSGGEGQRVRLGRALLRDPPRLVVLDEPFRGLGREQRARLLGAARDLWAAATLLCVTHDLGETLSFGRVIVVDGGRIAEDGSPRELLERPGSLYRSLLETADEVDRRLWSAREWRRIEIEGGSLREESR
jgi:ABC-type multidrug transport system fused ATPase/permease subunit